MPQQVKRVTSIAEAFQQVAKEIGADARFNREIADEMEAGNRPAHDIQSLRELAMAQEQYEGRYRDRAEHYLDGSRIVDEYLTVSDAYGIVPR